MRTGTDSDEEPFPLDAAGFLDDSVTVATAAEELVPGMLVHPSVAAGVGALVLLGEPGVGKTTVFTELTNGLLPLGDAHDGEEVVLHLDAVRLTDSSFDALLGRHLRQLPTRSDSTGRPVGAVSAGFPPALTIVIDQLDESPMLRRFAPELAAALTNRDTTGLRILIACRTADYPTTITEVLSSALGGCVLADLAPLTRLEAVKLANSAGVSGEDLVTAAATVAAGTLASVPLTLDLLVRIYLTEARLPPTAAEVFAKGVQRLADEHDPDRRTRESAVGVDERVAIAGRIAARLLFAGRRTIWTGPDLDVGVLDVRSGSLAGGLERVVSGQFNVTAAAVSETIGTALFTGRGTDRLAFTHSSIAAYLAARYLIDHDVPEPQLRSLFLVAAEDATTSIPAPLREAAAWLAALDPDRARWLAEADPESLASHSLVVDSFAMRALVVESLLARAPEIELGEHRWLRSRWRLEHPRLGEQLLPVFRDVHDGEPQDWATNAQVRLAARLAQEARARELVDPLLHLAEHEGWSAHMRRLAAVAAFETAPEEASARLKDVLNMLANASHAAEVDPDDELRGAILDMLWPDHLRAEEILVHLRPRRRRSLFGSYALFLRTMPNRLSEDDVAIVLAWAERATRQEVTPADEEPIEEASLDTRGPDEDVLDPSELPVGRVDTDLIDALVDRALASERAEEHLEVVSAIFRRRMERHDDLAIPEPLDLVDTDGNELERSRELRRALALALLRQMADEGEVDRGDCWQIISGWRGTNLWRKRQGLGEAGPRPGDRHALIDSADLPWALDAADDCLGRGEVALARGLGALASMIFDCRNVENVDLVAGRQDNPAWEFLRWWFEPVRLDSPEADTMRQQLAWSRPRETPPWPEAEAFQERLRDRFAAARSGDSSAFWQLAWNLQFDPATGHGKHQLADRLLAFPGVAVLGDHASQGLVEAAQQYLRSEHDHAEEWLGTDQYDKRAWAAYLALALLHEHGELEGLDGDIWSRWCGALVWFHAVPVNAGDRDRKVDLLSRAARSAPRALSRAAVAYVRGELARGGRPWEAELLDPRWSDELRDVLVQLLAEIAYAIRNHHVAVAAETTEIALNGAEGHMVANFAPEERLSLVPTTEGFEAALDIWERLLGKLLESEHDGGFAIALATLRGAAHTGPARRIAVSAARRLLVNQPSTGWSVLRPYLSNREFATSLALGLAHDFTHDPIVRAFDEEQLGDLYRWLADLFPPEEDREIEGVHAVGEEEQARHWREAVLRNLANRGTDRAVAVLADLTREFPERLGIAANLVNARAAVHANAWSPPTPEELAQLFADVTRRLVRSNSELLALVIDVLLVAAAELPSHCELLWDRTPASRRLPRGDDEQGILAETWRPKPEAALSAYLAHELQLRLTGRGVAVNREILVRPTNAYGAGDRTDIAVEAPLVHDPFTHSIAPPARVAVVVEVKGCWNPDLRSAQRDQLAVRYLPEALTDHGAYVVGWYPITLWTAGLDPRRTAARRVDRAGLESHLAAQAGEILRQLRRYTRPLVIAVPRPFRSGEVSEAPRDSDL